jgi:BirA family transcriptional regulator, biotin operon repressor / biotin---[acetyl-CoA-carboxylase] ligase
LSTASAFHNIGSPFIELQSVDSTNNYALDLIHEGLAQAGTAFFAYDQVKGKGQREKIWKTEKGSNIVLSLILEPKNLKLSQQFHLSACIAISVHEFFAKYAGDETRIKWPNDLYWRDRKAAGILIENVISTSGNWQWAVVGVGININQTSFADSLTNPVSLKQITGKNFDPVLLAKELCIIVNDNYFKLLNEGQQSILETYNRFLYKKDETVKLKKDNRVFEVQIKEVSPEGKLKTLHAIEEEFDFGGIEWIL